MNQKSRCVGLLNFFGGRCVALFVEGTEHGQHRDLVDGLQEAEPSTDLLFPDQSNERVKEENAELDKLSLSDHFLERIPDTEGSDEVV
eukprot:CAMPEP_0175109202 /NCGR_PEP_ID=MMETSP0086_2-20121207/13184_1 /TAXON_ID=136419 /ORGANISM="Unknown Unknown, Strain D1" /LENGTH=87 /DNA_ID=CAMNT_0016386743 /DNA_START=1 /DNA_END=261 /DNA_ORIENTATION=+